MPSCNKMDISWNITWRESGQTSVWSFLMRELVKPMKGEKQMTVELNNSTGASPNLEWHSISWKQVQANVNRLQVRIVKALKYQSRVLHWEHYEWLEPCAVKVASTVLRGGWCGNTLSLPDIGYCWRILNGLLFEVLLILILLFFLVFFLLTKLTLCCGRKDYLHQRIISREILNHNILWFSRFSIIANTIQCILNLILN